MSNTPPEDQRQKSLEQLADEFAASTKQRADSFKLWLETSARTEHEHRRAIMFLAVCVAMQPNVDAKRLRADFDRQIAANIGEGDTIPVVMLDIRAALAQVP